MTRSTFTDAGNIVHPSDEDWERAREFVDGPASEGKDPEWCARHRDNGIRQIAILEMAKRQDVEWRARFVGEHQQRSAAA